MPLAPRPVDRLSPRTRWRYGARRHSDPLAAQAHNVETRDRRRELTAAVWTPHLRQTVLQLVEQHGVIDVAARMVGLSAAAVYGRMRHDEDLAQDVEAALRRGCRAPSDAHGTVRGYRAGGRCTDCRAAKALDRGPRTSTKPGAPRWRRRRAGADDGVGLDLLVPAARLAYGAPDGHGRFGVLDRRDDDGRVLCHECGRWFRHLATHLASAHGIRAADYRSSHGLSPGTALIGSRTRAALAAGWQRHRDLHTAALDAHRDPDRARAAMTPEGQRAPERVARRIATGRAGRTDLTPQQAAELGDWTDVQGWAHRARALRDRDGVSVAAIARAVEAPVATVWQRLRRHG